MLVLVFVLSTAHLTISVFFIYLCSLIFYAEVHEASYFSLKLTIFFFLILLLLVSCKMDFMASLNRTNFLF